MTTHDDPTMAKHHLCEYIIDGHYAMVPMKILARALAAIKRLEAERDAARAEVERLKKEAASV